MFSLFFLSALFPLIFLEGVFKEEKGADKMKQKNGTCFLHINPVSKIPQNEMVLFFFIFFNRSDLPQKALSGTLETVSAEVCFDLFFGSFLCFSMEW